MTVDLTDPVRLRPVPSQARWRGWAGAGALLALVLGLRIATLTPVDRAEEVGASGAPFPTSPAIEAAYGVRIVQLDLLAAGGFVELRYLVLDPSRASALHEADGRHLPHIVTSSGAEVRETPFHSHATQHDAGASYSILYRNDGGAVVRGDIVDVVVDDLRLVGVVVR